MHFRWLSVISALFLVAASAFAGTVSKVTVAGVTYVVYRCRPDEVKLFWKDNEGRGYEQFEKLQQALAGRGERLVFAMNAGIYRLASREYAPCGLHIENGRTMQPLNRSSGNGNFYLKPTGVFYVLGGKAGIVDTEEFFAAQLKPQLALQSGPLLLRKDVMHPAFRSDSLSRLHRNGVGIAANGDVLFAITVFHTDNVVNLYGFAELFRKMGCEDALFLDGDISTMWTPEDGPAAPAINNFAAILAVTQPAERK